MVYDLGIDVGTSYTAAAIRRADGTVEVVGLGPIADNIPSVVYLGEDGTLIVGDAAARRAAIDPSGAAREFKRRLGDPTPLILRTSPFSAEALIGKMIDHVVGRVTDRERDRPRHTVVTHPANWGPYKLELFAQSFRMANLEDHSRLAEPQAAAMAYAAEARVPDGAVVAVYDLGGGTFDAAVLRKTASGFEPLGENVGIEHLGGVDFDEAVMHHVRRSVGERWPTDPDDPSLPAPMLHLRRACMEAKELLSSEQDVQIPVLLPGVDTTVPLDRAQFESMITPRLEDTIAALEAAISSAGTDANQLSAVLLVGGSSRIPLVGQLLRQRYGSLVAGDIDPLYAVARGAALAATAAAETAQGIGPTSAPSFFSGFSGSDAPDRDAGARPGVPRSSLAPSTLITGGGPPPQPAAPAAVRDQAGTGPAVPVGSRSAPPAVDPPSGESFGPPPAGLRASGSAAGPGPGGVAVPASAGPGGGVGFGPPAGQGPGGGPPGPLSPGTIAAFGNSDRPGGPPAHGGPSAPAGPGGAGGQFGPGVAAGRFASAAPAGPGLGGPGVAGGTPGRPGGPPGSGGPNGAGRGPDRPGPAAGGAPLPLAPNGSARRSKVKVLVPLLVVALLAAAGGAYVLTQGGDGGGGQASGDGREVVTGDVEPVGTASAQGMTKIPGGSYTLGSDKPEPNNAETLTAAHDVAEFFIDTYEVSHEEFKAFFDQKDADPPASWPGARFPDDLANHPVQGVSFDWATAYCASLGKRLPTEKEWEVAARGSEARLFPWGANAADGKLQDSGTYERGTAPANVSQFGVFDLAGNVWEWVGDTYDRRADPTMHILRGGQNGYLRRNSIRLPVSESSSALKIVGFRCAASSADETVAPLTFGDVPLPEKGNEPTPTTLPEGVLFRDDFEDATSGWVEKTTDTIRFGYHPNGFFHLETKAENQATLVESSFSLDPAQKAALSTSAFVDPSNTNVDAGIFAYGLLFRLASDGKALIFVVDPRSGKWAVCSRPNADSPWVVIDAKPRAIPDTVNLEVRITGPDSYAFFIGGAQVFAADKLPGFTGTGAGMVLLSYAGSKKAHIHFQEFQIRELD